LRAPSESRRRTLFPTGAAVDTNEPIREGLVPPPLPSSGAPDAAEIERRVEQAARRVGRGTTIMVTSTIVLLAAGLVARIAAARALPVSVWGSFNLGVSFTSLLSVVILLGLNQAVARSLAYEHDDVERHAIVRWSLIISASISTVASVLTFVLAVPIAAVFHDPTLVGILQLLAISVGMGAITPVYAAIFQGFHNVIPNALFNQILNPLLFAVFTVALVYFGLGLLGCIIAYVIADVAGLAGIMIYYNRRIGKYLPSVPPSRRFPHPRLWTLSVALWGVASLAFVTAFADTLILGAYWPALQVGYYSTAMTLARVLLLGGSALTYVTLPIAAQLAREKAYPELGLTYVTATRWTLFLSFPLLLLFGILPQLTIRELFTARYLPAAFPLQFLVLTAFLSTALGPVNATLAGLGKKANQATSAVVSATTNVILSFALIPTYGVLGAAIAWGVARALYPALGLSLLNREFGIHPFRAILIQPLAVSLAIGVPLFVGLHYLPTPGWAIFPLFFVATGIYALSLLLTKSLARGDFTLVEMVERVVGRPFPKLRAFMERFVSTADVPTVPRG
jgi:O-antigen/teichoic acid export membrane protein